MLLKELQVVYYVGRSDAGLKRAFLTGRSLSVKALNVALKSLDFSSQIIGQKSNKATTAAEENPTKISSDFHWSPVAQPLLLMSQSGLIPSAVRVGGKGLRWLRQSSEDSVIKEPYPFIQVW